MKIKSAFDTYGKAKSCTAKTTKEIELLNEFQELLKGLKVKHSFYFWLDEKILTVRIIYDFLELKKKLKEFRGKGLI